MIVLFNEAVKVILDSDKHLIIKNFKELKSINDDYILVDNYLFIGNLLKITILSAFTFLRYHMYNHSTRI